MALGGLREGVDDGRMEGREERRRMPEGSVTGAVRAGRSAPRFDLPAHDGGRLATDDLQGRGFVLAFVPSPWTPAGEALIAALRARAAGLRRRGVDLAAVAIADLPSLRAWAESMGGPDFPILSDFWPHGAVSERWGVLEASGNPAGAVFLVDASGVVRYSGTGSRALTLGEPGFLAALAGGREEVRPVPEASPGVGGGGGAVTVYASTWCPDCHRARAWLRKRGIEFREIDIYADEDAAALVRGWAGGKMVVPTFDVGGEILVDFDPRKLARLLKKKTGPG
jgi:peroxiredoxin/glutaredoxin